MGNNIYYFCRWCLRRIFYSMDVYGEENIPAEGGVVVACNHTSFLDPMISGAAFPRVLGFMARKSLFDTPLFGWFIRNLNAFPVDREGGSKEALRQFCNRLKEGHPVLLFPEGTRSNTGCFNEIKAGVGMIAVRSGAPVLPIFVWGAYNSWPRGKSFPRPHKIKYYIGQLIVTAQGLRGAAKKAEQARINSEYNLQMLELQKRAFDENGGAPVVFPHLLETSDSQG